MEGPRVGPRAPRPGSPASKDAWEGWEDSAVLPHKLGDYLRDLRKLLQKYGYNGALYGHFGQGCIHTRIDFDLKTHEGIRHFRAFLDEAADLVGRYGGSLSGEHGDGQSKAALLPKMFGPELVQAFREFKAIWDPQNKMNPQGGRPCAARREPAHGAELSPAPGRRRTSSSPTTTAASPTRPCAASASASAARRSRGRCAPATW